MFKSNSILLAIVLLLLTSCAWVDAEEPPPCSREYAQAQVNAATMLYVDGHNGVIGMDQAHQQLFQLYKHTNDNLDCLSVKERELVRLVLLNTWRSAEAEWHSAHPAHVNMYIERGYNAYNELVLSFNWNQ